MRVEGGECERQVAPVPSIHQPSIIYNALSNSKKAPFHAMPLVPRVHLNHDSGLHSASETRRAPFQIHPFQPCPPLPALADQVAKISPCNLALLPDCLCFLSRPAELLDAGLQPSSQGLGGVAKDLAHFRRDAGAVGVGVIECGEGVSDASRESGG